MQLLCVMVILTAQIILMKNDVVIPFYLLSVTFTTVFLCIDVEPKCPSSHFTCFSNNRCIDSDLVCDEKWDCDHGEDEINCGKQGYHTK